MSDLIRRRRRRFAILKALTVVMAVVGITGLAMSAFQLGLTTGLTAACGCLVAYTIPAVIFDWPRLTVGDVVDFIGGLLSAIGSFFSSLFDW